MPSEEALKLATLILRVNGIINDIGVFPTANYADFAAFVEAVRTRLIDIEIDTGAITWGDITGIVNDLGVFPTANYATFAAFVEDVRTRLIAIPTVMRGTDGAALVGDGWDAALATILDAFSITRIENLDRIQYHVVRGTWFSDLDDIIALTQAASDDVLPPVTLPNIGGTIDRVYLGVVISSITNDDAAANGLSAAVNIRIMRDDGAWGVNDIPAINLPDNALMTAGTSSRDGVCIVGDIDISAEVDVFNDTYLIRIEDCTVDNDLFYLFDVQTFLIVYYH